MSILLSTKDNVERHVQVLSGASATTLFTGRDEQTALVIGVNVANRSGASAAYVLDTYDGTTQVVWQGNTALADGANDYIDLRGVPIVEDNQLRITGVSGMHVTAIVAPSGQQ